MFGLETQGTNTYLVYEQKETDRSDTVTLGMLKNNEIEGILPFTYVQMDQKISFKYNITSKIALARFLQETVTKKKILCIWRQIIDTLLQIEDYMILGSNMILDLENIYINVSSLKVEMVCIPIRREEDDLESFFKAFIYQTHFSQDEDTSYVVKLIEYFNGTNSFSVIGLKNLIEELDEKVMKKPQPSVIRSEVKIKQIEPIPDKSEGAGSVPAMSHDFESSYGFSAPTAQEKPKKKGLFGAKKEKKPKKEKVQIQKKEKASDKKQKRMKFAVPGQTQDIPTAFSGKVSPAGDGINKEASETGERTEARPVRQEVYREIKGTNFGETTVLNADAGETTVLSMEQGNSPGNGSKYLIRSKNQQKILISKPVFKIGKEAAYADYCIGDNSNISRSHADIIERGNRVFICDNNSTNHTYVNDMMISPGEEKEIRMDDRIRLADEEFVFKIFNA